MYETGRTSGERREADTPRAKFLGDPLGDNESSCEIGECNLPLRSDPKVAVDAGRAMADRGGRK